MAYVAYRTWVVGETLTAALLNEQLRDNGLLTAPAILTAAGDMIYATGTNAPARLAKGTAPAYLAAGAAPSWDSGEIIRGRVNFNGTGAVAINDHYNVDSITDNGTGDYTVNWTVDFANANYAAVATANSRQTQITTLAAGTTRVVTTDASGTVNDADLVCVIAVGDR